jgi:hypothetical protein
MPSPAVLMYFIRRGHFGQLSGSGETGAGSIAFLKTPRIGQKRTGRRKNYCE